MQSVSNEHHQRDDELHHDVTIRSTIKQRQCSWLSSYILNETPICYAHTLSLFGCACITNFSCTSLSDNHDYLSIYLSAFSNNQSTIQPNLNHIQKPYLQSINQSQELLLILLLLVVDDDR